MRCLRFILLITSLVACSTVQQATEPTDKYVATMAAPEPGDEESYWWHARFRMAWPESGAGVDFYKDLLVINEVIAPVIKTSQEDIKLWRFHRRARRDAAGHQLSFIFYGSPHTASEIFEQIDKNPLLAELIRSDILREVKLDNPAEPASKNLADTSDPSWPPSLQASWPYFIMGVSVMYLDLVERELADSDISQMSSVMERLAVYRAVNKRLTLLWKERGGQALFHHTSAIFGYEALELRF